MLSTVPRTSKNVCLYANFQECNCDLVFIGRPYSIEKIVAHNLSGLKNDFKDLKYCCRHTIMTFEDLHDKFLDHEASLKCEEGERINTPITAQFQPKNEF